ncbi:hypothetical protein niasHS_013632 [Heterodera schachtii]|uniref:Cytochrome P450 n=1 Tax=Heterodera schachtii TaxID=97005 RepID=A0ABD2ISS1_HETSC
MKVANVDTFLWPKLLYGIDELRNQYNSGSNPQMSSLCFAYDQSTRKVWLSKGISWLDIDPLPASAHYYAFGGGPRICIGMRFALLEEKMALVRLLGRYSLAKTEQTEKLLKVNSQVVLNPGAVMRHAPKIHSWPKSSPPPQIGRETARRHHGDSARYLRNACHQTVNTGETAPASKSHR